MTPDEIAAAKALAATLDQIGRQRGQCPICKQGYSLNPKASRHMGDCPIKWAQDLKEEEVS